MVPILVSLRERCIPSEFDSKSNLAKASISLFSTEIEVDGNVRRDADLDMRLLCRDTTAHG